MQSGHLSNEDQAVNNIYDTLKACYKVAMKRFIDNVVVQITERVLVKALNPEIIHDLQDNELMELTGENFATSSNGHELMNKYERFQKASDIAKQALV
jgi:hypothetical protein